MKYRLLTNKIGPNDLVPIRDGARAVADLSRLDKLACTRFVTAVSEVARHASQYADGGSVTFLLDTHASGGSAQRLRAEIECRGCGFHDAKGIADSDVFAGSRRLSDHFSVSPGEGGGTVIALAMNLPARAPALDESAINAMVDQLGRRRTKSPIEELQLQNTEMVSMLQALKDRQAELELADERKNQFVATLAHELRNPLGTIQMTLYVMRHDPAFQLPALQKHLAVVARQSAQMNELVKDLMDMARVSQGKVELKLSPTNMNELVSEAVEMTGAATGSRHHNVNVLLHAEPVWVNGDATRLKQVVSNLMQNAARYSDEHGQISVRVSRDDTCAVVEVADRGIGIAPEMLPHIFGLFVQGDRPLDTPPVGLGIGLALVKRLVAEHGGSVVAASRGRGHGSRFTVTLPLCAARAPAA